MNNTNNINKLFESISDKLIKETADRSDIDSGNDETAFDDYNNIARDNGEFEPVQDAAWRILDRLNHPNHVKDLRNLEESLVKLEEDHAWKGFNDVYQKVLVALKEFENWGSPS